MRPQDLYGPPIDPARPRWRALLQNLQGNILKPHGRDHAAHLLLHFREEADRRAVRQWIAGFAESHVTSAARQIEEAEEYRKTRAPGKLFGAFYLSARGYERLVGLSVEDVASRFDESPGSTSVTFCAGMEASRTALGDPRPGEWDTAYRYGGIHAMTLLAHDDPGVLAEAEAAVRAEAAAAGIEVLATEYGTTLRDEHDQPIEHFGYRDGISQPLFLQDDVTRARQRSGWNAWDPAAPLDLVLVPDPFSQAVDSYGSYLVYRKLEQDVRGFQEAITRLAQALSPGAPDVERAGALVVGRYRNGVPILLSPTHRAEELRDYNNFDYQGDPTGSRCPFHAHIRRTNPRGAPAASPREPGTRAGQRPSDWDLEMLYGPGAVQAQYGAAALLLGQPHSPPGNDPTGATLADVVVGSTAISSPSNGGAASAPQTALRDRRIARRGIPYDERPRRHEDRSALAHPPDGGVGLLFMCFQSSIAEQFAFLQIEQASVSGGSRLDEDPVLGAENGQGQPNQAWPIQWGGTSRRRRACGGFVRFKGGEFFFAPSLPFLASLADLANRSDDPSRGGEE